MASRKNLNELYAQFLRNESSPEDVRFLMDLFGAADYDALQEIVRTQLEDPDAIAPYRANNEERYDRIFNNLKPQLKPAKIQRKLWVKIAAAASILLALGTGGYYILQKQATPLAIVKQKLHNDVGPGGNKAYLVLSNGQSISLNGDNAGLIGKDAGKDILKTTDGQIKYVDRHNNHISGVAFNTLQTPNGGHYKLVLADGTKVWLNAASQLKYPADFKDLKQRKVELSGEAYFEVAKDAAHPFIVQTDDQQIMVLGTHFNVNAYHDNGGSKTTLLEGSIRAAGKHAEAIIKPGQQVISNNSGTLNIDEADTELAVAWKNDQFMFESEPIRLLMKDLSRWYNVEIIYGQDLENLRFNGAISKFENISAVLQILESTGKVHFEVSGRKVYITKH